MQIRKVTGAGDWRFGHSATDIAQGNEAIGVNIQTRLLSWLGDCFFALEEGVDWKNRLDVGQTENLKTELKTMILQSFGVVQILAFTASFDSRRRAFQVSYSIETIFSSAFKSEIELTLGA